MIEAENLTKYYGNRSAVRDLTFQVGKGEIVGLLGPNGAGKTTTMRMLTGYLPIDRGRAVVAGYDVSDRPMEVRKRLGYLPETVPLYTEMPVNTYLDFTAKIRGVPANGRKRRIEEVMELCRIADVKNKVIGKLSRGYKQRVGLAQAIIHNPQVIILDEPTVGLDPRQIIEIRKVIRDLAGNHSIVLSTHILPEVSALCDRVVIVNRGRVLVEDTLANLERRDSPTERLRVEIRGPEGEIREFLATWPGVVAVEDALNTIDEEVDHQTGVVRYELVVAAGNDVREGLAGAIVGKGWGLLEIRTVTPSLEEIFVKLVNDDLARLEEEEAADDPTNPATGPLAARRSTAYQDEEMDEVEAVSEAEPASEEVLEVEGDTPRDAKRRVYPVGETADRKAAPAFLNNEETETTSPKE